MMHMDCCFEFWSSLRDKRSRGIGYEGMEVLEEDEFACPICKTISEFVVPIVALPGQTRTGNPLIDPNVTLNISDDPSEMVKPFDMQPYIDDRPSVISSVQMFLDKVAPVNQLESAILLCTGTILLTEFASRSNTLPLTKMVKEKDLKHLTYLLDTTRTAVTGIAPHVNKTRGPVSPRIDSDIIYNLVYSCSHLPGVDSTLLATHFVSRFRVLFVVGLVQCITQAIREEREKEKEKDNSGEAKEGEKKETENEKKEDQESEKKEKVLKKPKTKKELNEGLASGQWIPPTNFWKLTERYNKIINEENNNVDNNNNNNNNGNNTIGKNYINNYDYDKNEKRAYLALPIFGNEYLVRLCEILKVDSSIIPKLGPQLETLRTFTRAAAILYSSLLSLPLPPISSIEDELPTLLSFLHLPPSFLQSFPSSFEPFFRDFASGLSPTTSFRLLGPPTPFSLVPLPESFYEFSEPPLRYVVCMKCMRRTDDTFQCLVCGAAVCPANPCCKNSNNVGECSSHAVDCCGNFGVYLALDKGLVLVLFKGITGIVFSIYLDPYGEEDIKLERGLPMTLNKERYEQVRELIATHSTSSKALSHAFPRFQV